MTPALVYLWGAALQPEVRVPPVLLPLRAPAQQLAQPQPGG
jgi:hypothetical protein